jgi:hypothetical protein
MQLACQLKIPLHRGAHRAGYGGDSLSYPDAVGAELEKIKETLEEMDCNNQKGNKIVEELNALSKEIFEKVKNFKWTITYDGFDYRKDSKIGCAGCSTFGEKRQKFKDKNSGENKSKWIQDIETDDTFCIRKHPSLGIETYTLEIGK